MERIRKTVLGIALAMLVSTAIAIGAFNKSFASTHWCVDGEYCIASAEDLGDGSYIYIEGWCASGGDYGSGIFFGCACANQFGAIPAEACSVM